MLSYVLACASALVCAVNAVNTTTNGTDLEIVYFNATDESLPQVPVDTGPPGVAFPLLDNTPVVITPELPGESPQEKNFSTTVDIAVLPPSSPEKASAPPLPPKPAQSLQPDKAKFSTSIIQDELVPTPSSNFTAGDQDELAPTPSGNVTAGDQESFAPPPTRSVEAVEEEQKEVSSPPPAVAEAIQEEVKKEPEPVEASAPPPYIAEVTDEEEESEPQNSEANPCKLGNTGCLPDTMKEAPLKHQPSDEDGAEPQRGDLTPGEFLDSQLQSSSEFIARQMEENAEFMAQWHAGQATNSLAGFIGKQVQEHHEFVSEKIAAHHEFVSGQFENLPQQPSFTWEDLPEPDFNSAEQPSTSWQDLPQPDFGSSWKSVDGEAVQPSVFEDGEFEVADEFLAAGWDAPFKDDNGIFTMQYDGR